MNASREGARRAMEALREWPGSSASKTVVFEFLQAAERKLPSEAAYDRTKKRSAVRTKVVGPEGRMKVVGPDGLSGKMIEDLPGM